MAAYMTIKETAKKWELTTRRVQKMCCDGKYRGFTVIWYFGGDTTECQKIN